MTKTMVKPKPDMLRIVLTPGVPVRLVESICYLVVHILRLAAGPIGKGDNLLFPDGS
jgi:hypothetical protein